ncbi:MULTISPECIES: lipopolysaccharide biosynthesis protein [unclassified Novosphingobium]|uniref:lipopolysaccharide biosynthesis protein n=1 Tax=unclassified Novosphingobium TaxID=2644732 RepID=UPI00135BB50A|nr:MULTISPECIES: lipopolysaccharide biosynthesis protein [unclassified Novosphingobium]
MAVEGTLRHRAAGAIGWSVVRFGGDQIFGFIVFAALAHRLGPATFGVFIVGLAVAEIGKIIAQGGLVSSLYRAKEVTPRLADTVFWANLAMGILVALFCFVLRRPLANALGSAEAAPVIAALGLVVPISAAGATHMSRNLREFGHRALAIRSLGAGLVGGTLALVAAEAGWGVWALVVQRFASEAIGTLVAWHAFRWRPGFDVSWSTLRAQWKLGASVAGSQLLLVALNRAQDVILSRMIGIGAVGVYRTAWKSIEVVAQGLITPFSTVAVPTLAKLKHDMPAFRRGYVKMVSTSAMIAFPAIAGIGVLADQIIPLLFGPQWGESIPLARVLCLLGPPFALNFFADPALTVLGRAGVIAKLAAIQLTLTLVFCIAAAPHGLLWFAVAYVGRAYVTLALQMVLLQRASGIRAADVLAGIAPALGASAVMAVVVWATGDTMHVQGSASGLAALTRLGFLILQGVLVYTAVLLLMLGSARRAELGGLLRSVLTRSRSLS